MEIGFLAFIAVIGLVAMDRKEEPPRPCKGEHVEYVEKKKCQTVQGEKVIIWDD